MSFCCYETRNVHGMYRKIQEIGDCKRVLCFSCTVSHVKVFFSGIESCFLIE